MGEGDLDMFRLLISRGANVNSPPSEEDHVSALYAATVGKNDQFIDRLLEAGADSSLAGERCGLVKYY